MTTTHSQFGQTRYQPTPVATNQTVEELSRYFAVGYIGEHGGPIGLVWADDGAAVATPEIVFARAYAGMQAKMTTPAQARALYDAFLIHGPIFEAPKPTPKRSTRTSIEDDIFNDEMEAFAALRTGASNH